MKNRSQHVFSSATELARAFAGDLNEKVKRQPEIHIALSGGSTPRLLYEILTSDFSDTDWSQAHFYWGDERCVPPDDAESNFKMAWDLFLSKIAIPSDHIHRMMGESDPAREALRYGEMLQQMLPKTKGGIARFDLVILGMGDDGHTASIFPDQMHLLTADSPCVVAHHPVSGQQRISLSGTWINRSREVIFLVTGAAKSGIVEEIRKNSPTSSAYPAAHILPHSGTVSWYLDEAAANG